MEKQKYKVFHSLTINGKFYPKFITDLQYDDGVPYAVFEWLDTPEGEIPSIRIELDPKYLHKANFGASHTHLYERPLLWPKSTPPKIINQHENPFLNM